MKTIILIISSVFLLSCKKTDLEKKITEKDSFWYIFNNDEENKIYKNINYGYEFFSNGGLDYMHFDFSTKTLRSYRMDDVIFDLTWKQDELRKMRIEGYEYQILKFEGDTLILKEIKFKKKMILINLRNINPEVLKIYKGKVPD